MSGLEKVRISTKHTGVDDSFMSRADLSYELPNALANEVELIYILGNVRSALSLHGTKNGKTPIAALIVKHLDALEADLYAAGNSTAPKG